MDRKNQGMSRFQRASAEALGTAFLLAAVVGSGIMAERLAGGNAAIALLANSLATGFALIALIVAFADRSGAHFNPAVTLALAIRGGCPRGDIVPYCAAQIIGALAGVAVAHAMFDLPLVQTAQKLRTGIGEWCGELVATFGLVLLILSFSRRNDWAAPFAVGGYIAAAYWFTSSSSFATPAVTLARGFTDTFAGIGMANVPAFVAFQLLGACLALLVERALAFRP